MTNFVKKEFSPKTFEIVQQMQFMENADLSIIESRIKSLTQIKTYALILHDKDMNEDGELKAPHFHAVVTLKNNMPASKIASVVGVPENCISKINGTTDSARLYLIHANAPEKYQYDANSVLSYGFNYMNVLAKVKGKAILDDILEKIASGEIKRYNMYQFIPVGIYAKYRTQIDNAFDFRSGTLRSADRNITCIFLTGGSGTGKTTYAKHIAEKLGYHVYVATGGKNPIDRYNDEECIIFDDLRDSIYQFADFLKLTDNFTASGGIARFRDKSLNELQLIVITSVVPLTKWYLGVCPDKEERKQLYRRFPYIIEFTSENLIIKEFDSELCAYAVIEETKNITRDIVREKPKQGTNNNQKLLSVLGICETDKAGQSETQSEGHGVENPI